MDILRYARDLGLRHPSETDVVTRLQDACAELEVEHACFASKVPGNDTLVGFATYSEQWRKHYLDKEIPDIGMSIPIRGPFGERSVLTLATRSTPQLWKAQKRNIMQQVQQIAARIHDEVMLSGQIMLSLDLPSLSTREIEILQWIAAGKAQQDVADILNISNRTVEVHLRSVRSKLGAVTTAQAVARAIGMQLIYPL